MPVILSRDAYDLWLDPGMTNVDVLSDLLKAFDARLMRSFAVSSRLNQVANDDEACSVPIGEGEQEAEVFLNINVVIKKGQFSIKDAEYSDLVLTQLAKVL